MKIRESGMPEEAYWETFFEPEPALKRLGLTPDGGAVVDIGCGYGTFAVAAARMTRSVVYAFDVEAEMVAATQERARQEGLENVCATARDVMMEGTGLADASAGYVMLFNLLHAEQPVDLLREAFRILKPGGVAGIMHWRYDPATPRGPSLNIRPRPEQCRQWAREAGFMPVSAVIDLPPYHYGLTARKPAGGHGP